MERLLILEDDLALGEGVRLALQGDDRPVTLCRTLAQARQALEEVPSKPRYLKTVYGIGYTWAVK